MRNRRARLLPPGPPRTWLVRLVAAAAILVFVATAIVMAPRLHPRQRLRALVHRVSEQVDVPGVRDCRGLLSHRSECPRGDRD